MLTGDYIYHTPRGGYCRVRIYTGGFGTGDLPVVICTEPTDNEGVSITNAAAHIAAQVLESKPKVFDPVIVGQYADQYDKPFIWIEHYEDGARGTPADPATFDLVEFSHYQSQEVFRDGEWVNEIGKPRREPLDRASVEALVKRPVD